MGEVREKQSPGASTKAHLVGLYKGRKKKKRCATEKPMLVKGAKKKIDATGLVGKVSL